MFRYALLLVLPVATLCLWACPDGGGGGEDVVGGDGVGPTPARSYRLGARLEGYDIQLNPQEILTTAGLGEVCRTISVEAPDAAPTEVEVCGPAAEAVVVPLDLYGIPWESFTTPSGQPAALPGAWLARLDEAMAAAGDIRGGECCQDGPLGACAAPDCGGLLCEDDPYCAPRELVVAISPISGTWDGLAPDASEQAGVLILDPTWRPYCYDPSGDGNPTKYRDAFAAYASWLVARYGPEHIVLGQRMNLFEENCSDTAPTAYDALLGFTTEAHRRLITDHAAPPRTIVTVDVEDLYGLPPQPGRCVGSAGTSACLETRISLLAGIEADALGLESYPASALLTLGEIPAGWLGAVAAQRGAMDLVIAGTGLPGQVVAASEFPCAVELLISDGETQVAWLDQVLASAASAEAPLVVWRAPMDLLPTAIVSGCPCAGDAGLCNHLSFLGNRVDEVRLRVLEGLWTYDGVPRLAADLWTGLLAP